jgi:hypothetical protein
MIEKRKSKHDDPEQSRRFVETAHKLGASEKEGSFDLVINKILPSKLHQKRRRT